MLAVTRKLGQSLYLTISAEIDPLTPVGEVFKDQPIVVRIARLKV